MNKADINRMARECTAPEWHDDSADGWHMGLDLIRFASLVAAAEREACAKVCDSTPGHPFRPSIEAAHAIRARAGQTAATPQQAKPVQPDGWLQEAGLLYRLTDGIRPENRDEINVTMADGSRSPEARARRASELLNLIRASTHAAPGSAEAPPSPTHGMNLGERIKHVGGRENAQGYIEFGSVAAVRALILQWLRDMPAGAVGDAVQVNVRLLNALTALLKEVAGGGTPTLDTMIEARGAIKEAMQDHSGSTGGATS